MNFTLDAFSAIREMLRRSVPGEKSALGDHEKGGRSGDDGSSQHQLNA